MAESWCRAFFRGPESDGITPLFTHFYALLSPSGLLLDHFWPAPCRLSLLCPTLPDTPLPCPTTCTCYTDDVHGWCTRVVCTRVVQPCHSTPPYTPWVHQRHHAHPSWVTGYTAGGQREGRTSWAQDGPGSLGRSLRKGSRARIVRKKGRFSRRKPGSRRTESGNNWIAPGRIALYSGLRWILAEEARFLVPRARVEN